MTFTESVSTCLRKAADFDGRAMRSEYWWFVLFTTAVTWGIMLVSGVLGLPGFVPNILGGIFNLAMILPSISVATRRLHDVNRSGWWQLIVLTIIGIIPLLYWLCIPGDPQSNDYGMHPDA